MGYEQYNGGGSPAVSETDTGSIDWTDASNVAASDDTYATCVLTSGQTAETITLSSWGFSIPSTEIITGVQVEIHRLASVTDSVFDASLRVVDSGSASGDDKADTANGWPTSEGAAYYGGPYDMWGVAWTPAKINHADTGFLIICDAPTTGGTASIDYMFIRVYTARGHAYLPGSRARAQAPFRARASSRRTAAQGE